MIYYEHKRYIIDSFNQIFVGSYKAAMDHARELKKILELDKDHQKVVFNIIK